jgi:hypothetical protein
MKAGLPQREPELLKRWDAIGLYQRLRQESQVRPKYLLHDGPPLTAIPYRPRSPRYSGDNRPPRQMAAIQLCAG